MRKKLRLENVIVFVFMAVIIVCFFFKSNAFSYVDEGIIAVNNSVITACQINKSRDKLEEKENPIITSNVTFDQVASGFLNGLYAKIQLCELNGDLANKLGFLDFYKSTGGIRLPNGYVAGVYAQTSTDYEIQQMIELKEFCDNEGIQLLYVNEPTKYIDDTIIEEQLGTKSYINQNADLFLSRLEECGINYIDLRDNIRLEGKNSFDMFFRTDHHWTPDSGKWAAQAIAEKLNEDYDYDIDVTLYNDSNYIYTEYKNAWLGEQGKKLSAAYVGLDDYTCIEPRFDTNYTVTTIKGTVNGTFSDTIIDKNNYNTGNMEMIYSCPSWHYSYMRNGLNASIITNNQIKEGHILVLGDSYDQLTSPFLSLGVNEVRTLVLRSYEGSLQEYIKQNNIDTVIVAYASFMIGAHDNPSSANYAMFDFH